mmetsp:Transcript_8372/g.22042  ORF Transcript_8372/g.22042 Transcript_8372/m.22042 type:complete len:210 (+) Transcript_8372:595-1224(+)
MYDSTRDGMQTTSSLNASVIVSSHSGSSASSPNAPKRSVTHTSTCFRPTPRPALQSRPWCTRTRAHSGSRAARLLSVCTAIGFISTTCTSASFAAPGRFAAASTVVSIAPRPPPSTSTTIPPLMVVAAAGARSTKQRASASAYASSFAVSYSSEATESAGTSRGASTCILARGGCGASSCGGSISTSWYLAQNCSSAGGTGCLPNMCAM